MASRWPEQRPAGLSQTQHMTQTTGEDSSNSGELWRALERHLVPSAAWVGNQ